MFDRMSPENTKRYFAESLIRSDYFVNDPKVDAEWCGNGAARLGLEGEVDARSYFAMCDGLNPQTGEKLTQRQKKNRRLGMEVRVDCPKGVSTVYGLYRDPDIKEAFMDSLKEMLTLDMQPAVKTRVRKGGRDEDRVTGNMAAAIFPHEESRPVNGRPDSHLHGHIIFFNYTFDPVENCPKAVQLGDLKASAPFFQEAFNARLARHLNDLGYATEKAGKSFDIVGVSQSVKDKFSQRKWKILADGRAKGITDPADLNRLAARNREAKILDVTRAQMREEWDSRLTEEERQALRKVAAKQAGAAPVDIPAVKALELVVDHSFDRASALSDLRLRAEALRHGLGSVLPEEIRAAAKPQPLIIMPSGYVKTRAMQEDELSMLDFARSGRGIFLPYSEGSDSPHLNAGQKAALGHVLASKDRVVGLRGGSANIRHVMRAVIPVIENPERNRHGRVHRIEAVDSLLKGSELRRNVKGGVLWVPEASLLSGTKMRQLFEVAGDQDCRIILSGDPRRQYSLSERTDAFDLLESEAGVPFMDLRRPHVRKEALPCPASRSLSREEQEYEEELFFRNRRRRLLLNDLASIIRPDMARVYVGR